MCKRMMLLCFSVLALLVTQACFFTYIELGSKYQKHQNEVVFEDKGTHIWGWNEGEQTCEVEDDMTLTIVVDDATLHSTGPCMSIQGLNPYTCYVSEESSQCTIEITGNYSNREILFTSCGNNVKASGSATVSDDKVTGNAKCGNDTYIFSLQLK